ncbi:FAD-dependent oxidoreductase [Rhodoferax sp. PAMC 29310]|uniref:FAD-dependent oxidoreductase n=1 Tax=Rhodoferax sp. PAMC 29310 TaxID=2822760 RepID=UPI001B340009|nr:FAD-dependent oxidoreductase [Rhodoferax sp. PAMC 29310]
MIDPDVLVIGGGPAGVAAATELADLGRRVVLVEQRDRLGGAIHRAYVGPGANPLQGVARHRRNWEDLAQRLVQAGDRIDTHYESVFLGVDGDGRFLLDERAGGRVIALRPKAVVLAVGAMEVVVPRPGWELPGVTTAGGLQVQMKETGRAPDGLILVAGTGPLPFALAAQLVAAGNPPVAVMERGQPGRAAWHQPRAALDGLRSIANVKDALGYGASLLRAGVPYLQGWAVVAVEAVPDGLLVTSQHVGGERKQHRVRHLALHDGLVPQAHGLPTQEMVGVPVIRAGDCREVLGADGALSDGRRAAHAVARLLGVAVPEGRLEQTLSAARRTQHAMATLCAVAVPSPDAETVICRCEGLRRGDLDALKGAQSAREIRLVGRFGMGVCQGRFCARHVARLAAEMDVNFDPADLAGDVPRWPLRPVSLSALAAFKGD